MSWVPTDDELDALARGGSPHDPGAQRAEQSRTAVLAGAARTSQRAPRPIWPLVAVPLAAAAAVAIWLGTRAHDAHDARDVRAPAVPAAAREKAHLDGSYANVTGWPDRVVRVSDGSVSLTLDALAPGERFRILAPDAELETAGARIAMTVASGHVDRVTVTSGKVELRVLGAPPVFLAAGQVWTRTITAQRDVILDAPDPPKPPPPPPPPRAKHLEPAAPPTAPPAPPAVPGEAEFRAGMTALRTGDAATATAAFASACAASHAALAEDACFWSGAAARRAGNVAAARQSLDQFLQRFPGSARAGEAAALLGWILYESGDLAGADRQFQRAAADRVPKVRESAQRGLSAVAAARPTK